jgi:hypothetical protein
MNARRGISDIGFSPTFESPVSLRRANAIAHPFGGLLFPALRIGYHPPVPVSL